MPEIGTSGLMSGDGKRGDAQASVLAPILDSTGALVALTKSMGIEEVVAAPRSPWQNPYVERLIGSIRRECLDHVMVWNETSLRRILRSYFHYYEKSRTHLALAKDAPEPRAVDGPENGRIVAIPQVGGRPAPSIRTAGCLA